MKLRYKFLPTLSLLFCSIRLFAGGSLPPPGDFPDDPRNPPEPPRSVPAEPVSDGKVVVTETIVLNKSGTYDFKNKLHIWKGKKHNCTADLENGPQILRIEADNVVVKNFHFIGDGIHEGSNGLGDPIHIASCGKGQGNSCPQNRPKHVELDGIFGHACEDLLTIGTPGTSDIVVRNSYFKANPDKETWDKTIQINFGSNIRFYNNIFVGGWACLRFKPNTNGEVIGNEFYNCSLGVLASSNDADISPMKNGPVRIVFKNNICSNCDKETAFKGDQVTFIKD